MTKRKFTHRARRVFGGTVVELNTNSISRKAAFRAARTKQEAEAIRDEQLVENKSKTKKGGGKRVRKKINDMYYSFTSDDESLLREFATITDADKMVEFIKEHRSSRAANRPIGFKKREVKLGKGEYVGIEPNIRLSASGTYQTRIGLNGLRFEKTHQTLDEARMHLKLVKKSGKPHGAKVYKERNCSVPSDVGLGKVNFVFDETINRMRVKYWVNGEFKTLTLSPNKTKELRDSLNGTIRRINTERKGIDSKDKRRGTRPKKPSFDT